MNRSNSLAGAAYVILHSTVPSLLTKNLLLLIIAGRLSYQFFWIDWESTFVLSAYDLAIGIVS